MMARRTKDELLAELFRLGDAVDLRRDYQIAHGPESMREIEAGVIPSHEFIRLGPGEPPVSAWLGGFKEEVNDINLELWDDPEGSRAFLAFYHEKTGRDWWADTGGDPYKKVRAIFRRGRVRNEEEWYLLKGILDDVDQTVFSKEEAETVEAMQGAFYEEIGRRRRD